MYPLVYPHSSDSNHSLGVMVAVIIPLVCLLCWLFNAHRMGKFRKKSPSPASIAPQKPVPLTILFGLVLGLLLGFVIRFLLS